MNAADFWAKRRSAFITKRQTTKKNPPKGKQSKLDDAQRKYDDYVAHRNTAFLQFSPCHTFDLFGMVVGHNNNHHHNVMHFSVYDSIWNPISAIHFHWWRTPCLLLSVSQFQLHFRPAPFSTRLSKTSMTGQSVVVKGERNKFRFSRPDFFQFFFCFFAPFSYESKIKMSAVQRRTDKVAFGSGVISVSFAGIVFLFSLVGFNLCVFLLNGLDPIKWYVCKCEFFCMCVWVHNSAYLGHNVIRFFFSQLTAVENVQRLIWLSNY